MSIYLGTTPISNTGHGKANTDLDNLTSTGKNIANWSNNVTNCITEIPQDIKLELNNGTLTLKAGSKVYKLDGTPITINTDVSLDTSYYGFNQPCLIYYSPLNNSLETPNVNICFSGSDYPTITTYQYMLYFDTTAKTYYWTSDNGTSWTERTSNSYPIAIATIGESSWQSIDQVFNGFGYIGSTIFALPGVKGLIPNGRNVDGSLKNTEFTKNNVSIWTSQPAYSWDAYIVTQSGTGIYVLGTNDYPYNETENYNYFNGSNNNSTWLGKITQSSGRITSLTPKTAFHAVDYNDRSTIVSWSMPDYSAGIDVTSTLYSNKSYTAPSKGVLFNAMIPTTNTQIKINGNIIGTRRYSTYGNWIPTPYLLDAGDVFSVTGWIDSNGGAYFFPLKGVN